MVPVKSHKFCESFGREKSNVIEPKPYFWGELISTTMKARTIGFVTAEW